MRRNRITGHDFTAPHPFFMRAFRRRGWTACQALDPNFQESDALETITPSGPREPPV